MYVLVDVARAIDLNVSTFRLRFPKSQKRIVNIRVNRTNNEYQVATPINIIQVLESIGSADPFELREFIDWIANLQKKPLKAAA